jgi:hypothetical protein
MTDEAVIWDNLLVDLPSTLKGVRRGRWYALTYHLYKVRFPDIQTLKESFGMPPVREVGICGINCWYVVRIFEAG